MLLKNLCRMLKWEKRYLRVFIDLVIFRPYLNMEGESTTERVRFLRLLPNSLFLRYDFEKLEFL